MMDWLRKLLGPRYRHHREVPCVDCDQLDARRRLHDVADRLNVLRAEVSLYEREERDDTERHDH